MEAVTQFSQHARDQVDRSMFPSVRVLDGASRTVGFGQRPVAEQLKPLPSHNVEPQDLLQKIKFEELDVTFDPVHKALWCRFAFKGRPSFTPAVLSDIEHAQSFVDTCYRTMGAQAEPIRYMVWASHMPGVFNLGGDLGLFATLIRNRDRQALLRYAMAITHGVYKNWVALDLPIITVSLVQGDALGGGFEGALSGNLIVAEKSAKFGLPEILFNLFPGMGAYTFLTRRINPALAERMILSGRIYGAEELYDMGVVDVLAEDGHGESVLTDYMTDNPRTHAARRAIYKARQRVNPVRHEELADIVRIWVDTAMELSDADLRKMERLVAAQDRRCARLGSSR